MYSNTYSELLIPLSLIYEKKKFSAIATLHTRLQAQTRLCAFNERVYSQVLPEVSVDMLADLKLDSPFARLGTQIVSRAIDTQFNATMSIYEATMRIQQKKKPCFALKTHTEALNTQITAMYQLRDKFSKDTNKTRIPAWGTPHVTAPFVGYKGKAFDANLANSCV